MRSKEFLTWLEGFLEGVQDCDQWVLDTIEEKLNKVEDPPPPKAAVVSTLSPIVHDFDAAKLEGVIDGVLMRYFTKTSTTTIPPKSTREIMEALRNDSKLNDA